MCKKLAGGVPIKKFGIRILEDLSYVPNTHGCIGKRHLHLSSTCSMFWVCLQILYEFFFSFSLFMVPQSNLTHDHMCLGGYRDWEWERERKNIINTNIPMHTVVLSSLLMVSMP